MQEAMSKKRKHVLPDDEIVELYWQRDERAIKETSNKYEAYLLTIAYNILHDRQDSEECTNDTYVGTWNSIPPARPNIFQIFLAKIARNIAIDRYRKNTAKKKVPSELLISLEELDECITSDTTTEEEFAMSEICRILNQYLNDLPERGEFVFVCRYYYADSIKHIAEMLKISESTIFRELSKLRDELKKRLQEEGYYHE